MPLPGIKLWPKHGGSYLVELLYVRRPIVILYSNKYYKWYHTMLSHIVKCLLSLILQEILIFKINLLHTKCNKTDKGAVDILIPRNIHHVLLQA
jgi:hypothetical protein